MSKLRVLVIHNDSAELDRISHLLEKGSHAVLPLENIIEGSEALELQRFDAVLLPENTPAEELAAFASNLRQMEKNRRAETRTPILSCSSEVTGKMRTNAHESGYIDAFLPEQFDPALFSKTVEQLSLRLFGNGVASSDATEELAVFDPEGFSELLGHSRDLLDEIIGLFLDECGTQIREMEDCLGSGNFDSLAKIAHTLKGSLGTLHAHRARARVQALEIAATRRIQAACETNLERLEADLDELLPLVIRMRGEL
ncbi:MAG TPA: Hpt domain-containing protein [Bryobacteraceae bacterium]|jgi:HPt (histidine-containing phosphotransfer) domain-containing protein|nr:Hpt domain-containing protein [Bryobacteraceae bacterium]